MYSKFFLDRLNARYDTNYYPVSNIEEHVPEKRHIDVYANSKTLPSLKLQVTKSRPYFHESFARARKEARKTNRPAMFGGVFAIEDLVARPLALKNYSQEQKAELILLLEHEYGMALHEQQFVQIVFGKYVENDYRGVYLVKLPNNLDSSSLYEPGEVVGIKNPFGENCNIF